MQLFVAAFSVPRMRASVSCVVLYFGMLKYAGTVLQAITTECSETPSAARKTAGKRRLRDFQPLNHIEHGLLPAERPKVSFVAAFSVPRMRASVSSVVLYSDEIILNHVVSPFGRFTKRFLVVYKRIFVG